MSWQLRGHLLMSHKIISYRDSSVFPHVWSSSSVQIPQWTISVRSRGTNRGSVGGPTTAATHAFAPRLRWLLACKYNKEKMISKCSRTLSLYIRFWREWHLFYLSHILLHYRQTSFLRMLWIFQRETNMENV